MGRPRKNPAQGLPLRMYMRAGAFYFVHFDGRWERLGRDFDQAKAKALEYAGAAPTWGTMGWWLQKWIDDELKVRVASGDLSERTLADYRAATVPLKAVFGAMAPGAIQTVHVTTYVTTGKKLGRAVRANREKAALSSCLSWMVAHGHAGLKSNPCRGALRNTEKKRGRYITDTEYSAVHALATAPVQAWMELVYRTLQRPSDILKWTRSSIIEERGQRLLYFTQGKTKAQVKIEVTEQLQAALDSMAAARETKSDYLICRRDGKPYKFAGLDGMFRRHVAAARIANFGIYDLKGKGATDMYIDGTPLAQIRDLCAHDSEKTTEIYIKARNPKVVQPNSRVINIPEKPASPAGSDESGGV